MGEIKEIPNPSGKAIATSIQVFILDVF